MFKKFKYAFFILFFVISIFSVGKIVNASLTISDLAFTSDGILNLNSSPTSNILIGSNLTSGKVGIGTTSPKTKLDINGGIKIGTATLCDANTKGSIRLDDSNSVVEFCNGVGWVDISGIPLNTISAFNGSCPTGWSELTEARGRTIIGAGQGSGLTNRTLASTGGEESHTLLQAELPNVNFTVSGTINPGANNGGRGVVASNNPVDNYTSPYLDFYATTKNTQMGVADFSLTAATGGSGTPLNVMQPYIALTWCKKITNTSSDVIPSQARSFDLSDFSIVSPQNGNILSYRNSISKWEANINVTVSDSGNVGVSNSSPTNKLDISGRINAEAFKLNALNTTPASSSDSCATGEIKVDENYIYICTNTNTFKRLLLTSW